jgi:SAM-dependent methyltransferase
MRMVRMLPPGSICQWQAMAEMVEARSCRTFIEIGCGAGDLSAVLCRAGLSGVGVDLAPEAVTYAERALGPQIAAGRFKAVASDLFDLDAGQFGDRDAVVSVMVMEHVKDDAAFLRALAKLARPGGWIFVGVPGRRELWSFEDETAGHYRRYDRSDLERVLTAAGLLDVEVWSVAVPIANMLFRLSDWLVRRSAESRKIGLSKEEQTLTTGLRDVPFKTVFPPIFALILNRYTLWPLLVLQRLFYRSARGVTLLAAGRRPG